MTARQDSGKALHLDGRWGCEAQSAEVLHQPLRHAVSRHLIECRNRVWGTRTDVQSMLLAQDSDLVLFSSGRLRVLRGGRERVPLISFLLLAASIYVGIGSFLSNLILLRVVVALVAVCVARILVVVTIGIPFLKFDLV